MGIERKYINSRSDFFRVLDQAIAQTITLTTNGEPFAPLESIQKQLLEIRASTAGGRTPTKEERTRVTIGLVVARELEPTIPVELLPYCTQLQEISGYFREWLTDEELDSYDDSDLLSDFDD